MRPLADIKQDLAANAEALALDLFGQPTSKTSQQWRWGRKGSIVFNVRGRWAGRFRDWETDEGGSALDAIMFAHGYWRLTDSVIWAQEWLGETDEGVTTRRLAIPSRRPIVFDVDAEEIARRDRAIQLWKEAVSIDGTASEKYLNSRGIYGPWPDAVRHHAGSCALIAASTAPDGNITAIQRVFLNEDGKAKLEDGQKIKRSFGPRYKGAVRLSGDDRALCLAEGPETGLSIWTATGLETWVGLGQVAGISLETVPLDRIIVVCRDDDPRMAPSKKKLKDTVRKWRSEGRTVLEVLPHERSRGDKGDFNDTLQLFGPEAIRDRIEAVLSPPSDPDGGEPLPWARKQLAEEMERAVDQLWAATFDNETPPALALKVSLGVGKTHEAIKQAVRHVELGRGNVVMAVPTHKLGGEIIERVRRAAPAGIEVASWRGREALDPEADGEQMCRDLDAVKDVQLVGGDPQKLVCISGDKRCAFADVCGYQRQRQQRGQIWIVTHQALFTQKPEAIPTPSLVIIDESFHGAGLGGTSGHPVIVTDHQIKRAPTVANAFKSADLMAELMPARQKLAAIIEAQELGPLSRQAVIDSGLTESECIAAGAQEWQRLLDLDVWPGMSPSLRQKAIKAAQENAEIPRMARMWRLLAELIRSDDIEHSGRLRIAEKTDEGATYKGLQLLWHEEIRKGWKAPTLHIDATMRLDLVRPFLPSIQLHASIKATAPHQHLTQYISRTFAKSSLQEDYQVDQVWNWCLAKARKSGGKWLVVVQKAVEDSIVERHAVPDFISLAHHNNVAGRDEWKDVTGLIVVGRTQPPVEAVAKAAGALSGRDEQIAVSSDGWYSQRIQTLTDAAGNTITIDADTAGDGIAEEMRWAICEGQIEQIIGRGRGVNRTEENPIEVHVLTNVPLTQKVDHVEEWRKPNIDEQLFAQSGLWLSSAGDMAKAHNNKRQAIRNARQRLDTDSYKELLYGNVSNLRSVTYQVAGPGRAKQIAVFDASIGDIRSVLAEKLGELAYCGNVEALRPSGYEPDVQLTSLTIDDFEPLPSPLSGILTGEMVLKAKRYMLSACWSQDQMASEIGISRPQFTNALQQRFGLGPDPTRRLLALLDTPPPREQLALL